MGTVRNNKEHKETASSVSDAKRSTPVAKRSTPVAKRSMPVAKRSPSATKRASAATKLYTSLVKQESALSSFVAGYVYFDHFVSSKISQPVIVEEWMPNGMIKFTLEVPSNKSSANVFNFLLSVDVARPTLLEEVMPDDSTKFILEIPTKYCESIIKARNSWSSVYAHHQIVQDANSAKLTAGKPRVIFPDHIKKEHQLDPIIEAIRENRSLISKRPQINVDGVRYE